MKITLKKIGDVAVPYDDDELQKWQKFSDAVYEVEMKNKDSRTTAQNRAMHLWCKQVADILNKNSLYMHGIFGNKIEWSMELVKTQIIKATIKKVFDIDSTTKLKRKEIDEMIDFVTIAFASKGVEIPPFPSRELWEK
ncbi:MAG: hypothetical protein QG567_2317 [Campylobacterota bacterium]|nr:hypothetical protein [Campylobacterota bacterium]